MKSAILKNFLYRHKITKDQQLLTTRPTSMYKNIKASPETYTILTNHNTSYKHNQDVKSPIETIAIHPIEYTYIQSFEYLTKRS